MSILGVKMIERRGAAKGFFLLLEAMVAISILGIALGGLYSAASGATRNVRADERYAFAVELGRSLMPIIFRCPSRVSATTA